MSVRREGLAVQDIALKLLMSVSLYCAVSLAKRQA